MDALTEDLSREYASALQAHLASEDETCRHRAYKVGRKALSDNVGVLKLAQLHADALVTIFGDTGASECERVVRSGHRFFVEALSVFEMAQRQVQDAAEALRHVNETLENEAKRIAHGLHDEAGQLLASTHLELDQLEGELSAAARARVERIKALLGQFGSELRRFSHELRPPMLDDLGLVPTLEFLAEGVSRRIGINVVVTGSIEGRPPAAVETALYRIVQEALANVAKHAHASCVVIELGRTGSVLHCSIRDDGVGVDISPVHKTAEHRGLGLLAIRERLRAVGGTLKITSDPGRGTELDVSIPRVNVDGYPRTPR